MLRISDFVERVLSDVFSSLKTSFCVFPPFSIPCSVKFKLKKNPENFLFLKRVNYAKLLQRVPILNCNITDYYPVQ